MELTPFCFFIIKNPRGFCQKMPFLTPKFVDFK